MIWYIDIEGKRNQRIMVKFSPKEELIYFIGQYKPHNKPWEDFSEITNAIDINLDVMKEKIFESFELLDKRLRIYIDLENSFKLLKTIEVVNEGE